MTSLTGAGWYPVPLFWIPAFAGMTILFASSYALGAPYRDRKADAGYPGEWLSTFSAGAREAALGGAGTAFGGPTAAYANPAGLARGKLGEMFLMAAPLQGGAQLQALSLAHPLRTRRYLGATFIHLGSGQAELVDSLGQARGSFSEEDYAFLVSYGENVLSGFDAGFSFKAVRQSIADWTDSSWGADIGARAELGNAAAVGISFINLVAPSINLKSDKEKFPLIGRIGGTLKTNWQRQSFISAVDLALINPLGFPRSPRWSVGLEWAPPSKNPPVFVRAGINQREYALGAGLTDGPLIFDYALILQELGLMHRVSVAFRFGYISPMAQRRLEAEWSRLEAQEERVRAILEERESRRTQEEKAMMELYFEAGVSEAARLIEQGRIVEAQGLVDKMAFLRPHDARIAPLREGLAKRDNRDKAEAFLEEARGLYQSGFYSKAAQAGRQALIIDADRVQAKTLVLMSEAQLLIGQGDWVGALDALRRVVEMDPEHQDAVALYRRLQIIEEVQHDPK